MQLEKLFMYTEILFPLELKSILCLKFNWVELTLKDMAYDLEN